MYGAYDGSADIDRIRDRLLGSGAVRISRDPAGAGIYALANALRTNHPARRLARGRVQRLGGRFSREGGRRKRAARRAADVDATPGRRCARAGGCDAEVEG